MESDYSLLRDIRTAAENTTVELKRLADSRRTGIGTLGTWVLLGLILWRVW